MYPSSAVTIKDLRSKIRGLSQHRCLEIRDLDLQILIFISLTSLKCIFSHDPSHFMNRLSLEGSSTPPLQNVQPSFQFQDFNAFPSLQPLQDQWPNSYSSANAFANYQGASFTPPPGFKGMQGYTSDGSSQRSRPSSRHQARENMPSAPALDDTEAFPSLGAVTIKGGKKHHGKRGGHGHGHKENALPSSLAEVSQVLEVSFRMSCIVFGTCGLSSVTGNVN